MERPLRHPAETSRAHFACFDCRKAFKQRGSSHWDSQVPERTYPCPGCQRPMARLGRHFKAPPQRARRQWLKTELLYRYGERFQSSRSGLGTTCRTLASAVGYLTTPARSTAEVRETLEQIRTSHQQSSDGSRREG